ncbi:MAG: mechanosensitive ion channel family protein [Euryarchaeota archaeon]|nr:mechanosensitive ion channel family protein [Euryarchaeota archaeon]
MEPMKFEVRCSMNAQIRYGKASMAMVASLFAVLLLLTMFPTASAGEINVLDQSGPSRELRAEESVVFEYVIYNNGTEPLVVKGTVFPDSYHGITASFEDDFVTLEPGESVSMIVTFTADRDVEDLQKVFLVNFTATAMNDLTDVTVTSRSVDLGTVSIFGVNAGENKIFNIWENDLPSPLDTNDGAFLVTLLGWILIGLLFYFVVDPAVHMMTKKTKTDLDDIVLGILRMPVFSLIVLIGAVGSIEILDISQKMLANIETIYAISLVLIGSWLAYKIYVEVVLHYAKKFANKTDTELDDVLIPVLEKIGMILFPFIAVMLVCGILGYDLTVFLAGAGFLGIVVGLAAQTTLANFFAGIQLLIDRPFKVGDLLLMDSGDYGEIKHIGLRATEMLDTTSNQLVIIPNATIANNKIINVVMPDKELTIAVSVGVAYNSDLELVKRLMVDSYLEMSNSKKDKVPSIRLSEFADSSINMKIFIGIDNAVNKWKAASEFREILYKKFKENGIEIPYPQSVVYVKTEQAKQ